MLNDIQEVLSDNLTLRKSYQLLKIQNQNITKQLREQKQKYKELHNNFLTVTDQNIKLYENNKTMQNQIININNTFTAQIQELKGLVQHKQNQLQNFQLKMIPTFDQDMLRVKIIAEMQGPYQEIVDKKDRENAKLKDQIHHLKRQKDILQFSLSNKQKQLKKQIEQSKQSYDNEIDRLTKQMSHLAHKNTSGKMQKDIMKSYRYEIDKLRATCQFNRNTEEQLRNQLINVKLDKEKLLVQFGNFNAEKAVEIRQNSNQGLVKQLKMVRIKLQDQLSIAKQQLQRTKIKYRTLQSQKKKCQQKYQAQLKDIKIQIQKQHQVSKNQMNQYKDQLRKIRDIKNRTQSQLSILNQKYQSNLLTNQRLNQEISNLKIKLNVSQSSQSYRYRNNQVDKLTREKIQRQIRDKLERQLRIKIEQQIIGEQQYRKRRKRQQTPKRQDENINKSNVQKNKITAYQQKIRKLTQKLEQANKKILQLLKEKVQRTVETGSRNRSVSYSPENDYHDHSALMLENRDCSFVPLCQPVYVSYLDHPIQPF